MEFLGTYSVTTPDSGVLNSIWKMDYVDAQSMFIAIKARFGGNDATKKTQKALLKQQYENFNATSSESLDSIFNRNGYHVVVWMNIPDLEKTMGLDDLYNNFKIVKQKVKRIVAVNNDDKNLAFLTTSSPSSTNTINTVNTGVSTGNTKGLSLFMKIMSSLYDVDLEEMDLKVPRSKDNRNWNQRSSSKAVRIEDALRRQCVAIDGSWICWKCYGGDEFKQTWLS
ncbi:hypothetical protein Tco_1111985 [Tanacetum coccineum]|uniref:Uncharacterized protein n=1 Tax=Tanacetum coccineum TaxID=301880 RepID=A0ABQ5IN68_9ASTR